MTRRSGVPTGQVSAKHPHTDHVCSGLLHLCRTFGASWTPHSVCGALAAADVSALRGVQTCAQHCAVTWCQRRPWGRRSLMLEPRPRKRHVMGVCVRVRPSPVQPTQGLGHRGCWEQCALCLSQNCGPRHCRQKEQGANMWRDLIFDFLASVSIVCDARRTSIDLSTKPAPVQHAGQPSAHGFKVTLVGGHSHGRVLSWCTASGPAWLVFARSCSAISRSSASAFASSRSSTCADRETSNEDERRTAAVFSGVDRD